MQAITSFSGEYRWLSNFFEPAGELSVEHYFQAAKALDVSERASVLACKTPGQAKRMGRKVQLRPDWNEVRVPVMSELVAKKFATQSVGGVSLKDRLLATGFVQLVEGNTWHDQVWGSCECGRPACFNPGMNNLGIILMSVRSALRQ